ncbi:MAG: PQQ-binding-like beta-propeller repeat protein, partial [Planctomycetota bacterium]|nr:PQQ-binding-like beta-propeller repeat protein [Planctomycetota bacterium]
LEGATCHVLDPATGQTTTEISLPQVDPDQPHEWGYIGVYQDVLLGGVGFANYRARYEADQDEAARQNEKRAGFGEKSLDLAASMALIGFDRHTGQQLWKVDALHSFWHNGIVAGDGLIFTLDRNPAKVEEILRRRGKSNPNTYRLLAIDARTGEKVWELPGQVFGTWLGYSETHGLLLQAGAAASDRLSSEVGQGMAVYRAKTGEVVWQKSNLKYSGPCVLHNDLIITNANSYKESAGAFHLIDGSPKMVKNSLTGKMQPWKITRAYGCNNIIASENLLTFRSGAAGFYDLLTDGGTGNFGGFKSGCTSNLVVADGVLNAPDYTRTCSCAYQNQTSLALVHMPEMDAWTISNTLVLDPSAGRVRQLGVNLGAPGDRGDSQGLMWLEYPAVAGDAPNLGLEFTGDHAFYQDHPTSKAGIDLPWVVSSGVEKMTSLRFSLTAQPPSTEDSTDPPLTNPETPPEPYRVRLHFGSPHSTISEVRVFDVTVKGQSVIENVKVGGNAGPASVHTIDRVMLGDWLEIAFAEKTGHAVISGIELQRLDN